MFKSYKYRIYPTKEQQVLMDKHFGCCRLVYNLALETKIEAYKKGVNLSAYDLQKQMTILKREYTWLNEVSYDALGKSILNLDNAYSRFFSGNTEFPKFKNKKSTNSFYTKQDICIRTNNLYIPRFREGIAIIQHRKFQGKIKFCTVSKTASNKYYASLLVDDSVQIPIKKTTQENTTIGIDLGLKTFATLSNGIVYESANLFRKSQDRLVILQRRLSRKKKGSNNRRKALLKVAKFHEKIANRRNHFLHNVSNEITNRYDTICIENLNIRGMIRNGNLSKSINDASWGEFVRQLSYKCEWKGKNLLRIDRFEPSTKTCSNCGNSRILTLADRTYNCECGLSIDRDLNAAINIKKSGMRCAIEPVELPTIVGTMKQENVLHNLKLK